MLIKPSHFSIRLFLVLAVLIFTAAACQLPAPPESTPEPSDVLFQDDFSDPSSGWDRVVTETGETDYMDGVYRIYANQPGTDIWATPGLHFTDVRIEVDAAKVGGPDDNDFGVICRAVKAIISTSF